MKKRSFGRVDFQVSVLSAGMVLLTTLCVFSLCYKITYVDMIASLHDRVMSIYEYVDPLLTEENFTDINSKEDINTEEYQYAKKLLEKVKNTTGVKYLYTAKETKDGELIYVIDGLNADEDFRYPGDEIEKEIQQDLRRALSGQAILPDKIKTTDWGKIFITYLPVHGKEGNNIIGAIGMEFEAEHQYNTYRTLNILAPIISILCCFVTVIIAAIVFRRISNPLYRDMANTDFATKLKNRNAFELDISNLNAKGNHEQAALISIDLDHLKAVNDTFGHTAGDEYIQLAAKAIKNFCQPDMIAYRVGGDEFAVLAEKASTQKLETYLEQVNKEVKNEKKWGEIKTSLSSGFALFCPEIDHDLFATYKRADQMMYDIKRNHKENK